MAFMIPMTLKKQPDTTAGERKLFELFRTALPRTCIVRYEILLGERHYRPDYTLIDPQRGVLVIEVKDWRVQNISKATPEQFYVRYGKGSMTPQMNPHKKCEIYLRHTRENLAAMPVLRGNGGDLHVPVSYLVAFPNISRQEFVSKGFNKIIPHDHALLREDLARDGQPFIRRYEQALPLLSAPLTAEQEKAVRRALFPNNGFALGMTSGFIPQGESVVIEDGTIESLHLSLEQERIAKSLGEGPRLLRGISGTGKTLIMLYRAKLLAANDPDLKILILCWNTSLANYMKQVYDKLLFQAQGQVSIQHFSGFARDLLGQYERSCPALDSPKFNQQLAALDVREVDQYDAIYVDEGQDFCKEWIAFLYHRLLKGEAKERNLLVAADDAQRIYTARDFSWASLDIPMIGRSKVLKTVYRNSARVWVFSAFLLEEKAAYLRENPDKVRFSNKGGYDPQLIACESMEAQVEQAIEIVRAVIKGGYAARNVLILYRHKQIKGFPLVDHLITRLKQEGIANDWIAEDSDTKRKFDWDAEAVKISTVHSAKGMDSPVVIILGAETFDPALSNHEYDETKLMYVALTRAREFLAVLYTGDQGLVPQLTHCQEQYRTHRDVIIGLETDGDQQDPDAQQPSVSGNNGRKPRRR